MRTLRRILHPEDAVQLVHLYAMRACPEDEVAARSDACRALARKL